MRKRVLDIPRASQDQHKQRNDLRKTKQIGPMSEHQCLRGINRGRAMREHSEIRKQSHRAKNKDYRRRQRSLAGALTFSTATIRAPHTRHERGGRSPKIKVRKDQQREQKPGEGRAHDRLSSTRTR